MPAGALYVGRGQSPDVWKFHSGGILIFLEKVLAEPMSGAEPSVTCTPSCSQRQCHVQVEGRASPCSSRYRA